MACCTHDHVLVLVDRRREANVRVALLLLVIEEARELLALRGSSVWERKWDQDGLGEPGDVLLLVTAHNFDGDCAGAGNHRDAVAPSG